MAKENAIYRRQGDKIDYTCTDKVEAGDVIMVGALAGVAETGGEPGGLIALTLTGVFEFTASAAIAAGDKIALTSGKAAKAGTSDTVIGTAVAVAVADGAVLVKINA